MLFSELPVKIELKESDSLDEDGLLAWLDFKNKKRKGATSTHRIRGRFGCIQCGRIYIRKDSLQRHLTYECGKEPQFQCPFCPQKCKRKAHRMRHIRRQHKDKIGLVEENNPDLMIKFKADR